jgi:hypothetical protein
MAIEGAQSSHGSSRQRNHLAAIPQIIQPVGPMLHQPHAIGPVLRPVVDSPDSISIDVGKL